MWLAQGKFLSECACEKNKGFFNSYFFSFFSGSNIIGNLVAAVIFKSNTNQSTLFVIFAVMSAAAVIAFNMMGKPI